jgi:hypothetical protein
MRVYLLSFKGFYILIPLLIPSNAGSHSRNAQEKMSAIKVVWLVTANQADIR